MGEFRSGSEMTECRGPRLMPPPRPWPNFAGGPSIPSPLSHLRPMTIVHRPRRREHVTKPTPALRATLLSCVGQGVVFVRSSACPSVLPRQQRPQAASEKCPSRNGPRSSQATRKLDAALVDLEGLGVTRVLIVNEQIVPGVGVAGAAAQICASLFRPLLDRWSRRSDRQQCTAPTAEQIGSKIDYWPAGPERVHSV